MEKQTRGERNNNPLNIKYNPANNWLGRRKPRKDDKFEEFTSVTYGIRAAMIIIKNYIRQHHINNLQSLIARWAPQQENNVSLYLQFVAYKSGVKAGEPLRWTDKNKICRIVKAMAFYESNLDISFGIIENAYAMAYYNYTNFDVL